MAFDFALLNMTVQIMVHPIGSNVSTHSMLPFFSERKKEKKKERMKDRETERKKEGSWDTLY